MSSQRWKWRQRRQRIRREAERGEEGLDETEEEEVGKKSRQKAKNAAGGYE